MFLDDVDENVSAARAAGWHAVVHTTTPESIERIESLLAMP
ncbi:hypothetical protein [Nocardioides currus]|nr:hypothetical protein [Nocardioides currus]